MVAILPVAQAGSLDNAPDMAAPIHAADRTRVLVLGTPHLATMQNALSKAHLEPVLSRLVQFHPVVIGVEHLSGESIQAMLARRSAFDPVIEHFAAWIAEQGVAAQKTLQLDADEARRRLHRQLAMFATADGPVPAQARRAAIALAIAAFEMPTAVLQWRYLEQDERKAADGISEAMRERLDRLNASWNEIYSVGVEVAHRLGLQQLASIDDHMDKDALLPFMDALDAKVQASPRAMQLLQSSIYAESPARQEEALEDGDPWPLYAGMNRRDSPAADVAGQLHLFFGQDIADALARKGSALWEVRKLKIASHIREAGAGAGTGHALVIIGAG